MRLIIAFILSFPFISFAEEPAEDFYLSCKDREGIFGGKEFISLVIYNEENKFLTIHTLNVKAEKDKNFYKKSILDTKFYPFAQGTNYTYSFGKNLSDFAPRHEVVIEREELAMTVYFTYDAHRDFDCDLIRGPNYVTLLSKFLERNSNYERSRKNHRATKNKI